MEKRYKLGKELGSGNFAIVKYATRRDSSQQKVAIKIINKALCAGKEDMIDMELGVLRKVDHPHIIGMHEYFDTPDKLYLVLDYVEGGELFDRIVDEVGQQQQTIWACTFSALFLKALAAWQNTNVLWMLVFLVNTCTFAARSHLHVTAPVIVQGNFTEQDASRIMRQMTEAIQYLHTLNIVHRDLKPENLLFKSRNSTADIMVTDFGLAKIVCTFNLGSMLHNCVYERQMLPTMSAGILHLICSEDQTVVHGVNLSWTRNSLNGIGRFIVQWWSCTEDSLRNAKLCRTWDSDAERIRQGSWRVVFGCYSLHSVSSVGECHRILFPCLEYVVLIRETDAPIWLCNSTYVLSVSIMLNRRLCGYPPFYDESDAALFELIMKGQFDFDERYWGDITKNVKNLISNILKVDPLQRLDTSQILTHPWITGKDSLPKVNLSKSISKNLKKTMGAKGSIDRVDHVSEASEPEHDEWIIPYSSLHIS